MTLLVNTTMLWKSKSLKFKNFTTYSSTSVETNFSMTLPAYSPGDIVVIFHSAGYFWNVPSGWTEQYRVDDIVNSMAIWRQMAGNEGATLSITCLGSSNHAVVAISCSVVDGSISSSTNSSTNNNDPPNLNLTTAKPTLWTCNWHMIGNPTIIDTTSPPAGYERIAVKSGSSAGGMSVVIGWKITNASSEDPGTFVSSAGTAQRRTFTVGIR